MARKLRVQFAGAIDHVTLRGVERRDLFGDEFVDHYVSSREWEVREYEKFVTGWQLNRYFEII